MGILLNLIRFKVPKEFKMYTMHILVVLSSLFILEISACRRHVFMEPEIYSDSSEDLAKRLEEVDNEQLMDILKRGDHRCGDGCYRGEGRDYNGLQSRAGTLACKNWDDESIPDEYRGKGESNYCRNPLPSTQTSPWCYTSEGLKTCGVRKCFLETKDCYNENQRGRDYKGNISVTASGTPCQKWNERVPNDPNNYFNKGEENYCRNPLPSKQTQPWCFTTSKEKRWEICAVPAC